MPAILFAIIVLFANINAQTTGYIPKWNGSYVNTVTPIYEDATNSRIGIGTTTPGYKLDVNGHMNITSTSAYKINGNNILWHNGNTADIFVGVNAGNATMSGHNNSCFGYNTGVAITTGSSNCFAGYEAGKANTTGLQNNFFGVGTGIATTTGNYNNFFGHAAGGTNTTGSDNCYFGEEAGFTGNGNWNSFFGYGAGLDNTADYNTFIGGHSGDDNSTGSNNVFMGYTSGFENLDGGNNMFLGTAAGYNNIHASEIVAVGYNALYTQSYGTTAWNCYNVAVGNSALYSNQPTSTSTGYHNTAVGDQAGYNNTTGYVNTFIASNAGRANTTGSFNSFIGYEAGYKNTTADYNTYVGYTAGYNSVTVSGVNPVGNTAVGASAEVANTTGSYNTYLGYSADATANNYNNSMGLGYNATVLASNNIYLGNTSVTGVWSQVGNWNGSDKRIKNNVQQNVPGLAFINLLKPVTYNYDIHTENQILGNGDTATAARLAIDFPGKYDIENISYTGFLAQAVDSAAQAVGYNFSGVYKPQDESKEIWGLNYSTFVPPMVKAIQELSKTVDSLEQVISQNPNMSHHMENFSTDSSQTNLPSQQVVLSSTKAILYQNNPNPAGDETSISYFLPENSAHAEIVFFDMYGHEIKRVELENKGNANLEVNTKDLDAGIYSYSLIVDGNLIDTLKFSRTK